uniref:Uncharacterized protein n=1 Tax=Sphaerodactylus townsendi TaxID=933632 RepID=A0ACB8ER61_9SAUR
MGAAHVHLHAQSKTSAVRCLHLCSYRRHTTLSLGGNTTVCLGQVGSFPASLRLVCASACLCKHSLCPMLIWHRVWGQIVGGTAVILIYIKGLKCCHNSDCCCNSVICESLVTGAASGRKGSLSLRTKLLGFCKCLPQLSHKRVNCLYVNELLNLT